MKYRGTIIILLFLCNITVSSGKNFSTISTDYFTPDDSIIIVTDSLIWNEVGLSELQRISIAGLAITSVPFGLLNGFNFLLEYSGVLREAAWIGPIGGFIGYPAFVTWSIIDIKKKKAKSRLLDKYKTSRIQDISTVSNIYIPAYFFYAGFNYSTFQTSNATKATNYSFGIRYVYPFNRYFAFTTGINVSKRDIWLRNKKYYDYWWMDEKVQLIDINYRSIEVYFPFCLKFSFPIKEATKFYFLAGTGFSLDVLDSKAKVNVVSEIEGERDYDYDHFDGPFKGPEKITTLGIGVSRGRFFYEIDLLMDNNNPGRVIKNVLINDKLIAPQFIMGYELPIK